MRGEIGSRLACGSNINITSHHPALAAHKLIFTKALYFMYCCTIIHVSMWLAAKLTSEEPNLGHMQCQKWRYKRLPPPGSFQRN